MTFILTIEITTRYDMDKAEYDVAMYHCYLRCEPQEEKCKDCEILKIYREIYDTGKKRENR